MTYTRRDFIKFVVVGSVAPAFAVGGISGSPG